MTYNVFGGTLSLTQSINVLLMLCVWSVCVWSVSVWSVSVCGPSPAGLRDACVCQCVWSLSVCLCVVCHLLVYVVPALQSSVLSKLSVSRPVSAVPPPEPRDGSAQSSLDCSSHDEEPSCSTQTQTDTDTDTHTDRHRHTY